LLPRAREGSQKNIVDLSVVCGRHLLYQQLGRLRIESDFEDASVLLDALPLEMSTTFASR
jgi:hypothetical protein